MLKTLIKRSSSVLLNNSKSLNNLNKYNIYNQKLFYSTSNSNNYKNYQQNENKESESIFKRNKFNLIGSGIAVSLLTAVTTKILLEDDNSKKVDTQQQQPKSLEESKREYNIEKFKYVIVGGGTAAYHAVDKILENDKTAEVLIISQEYSVPYQRPPLSKNLWASEDPDVTKNLQYTDWSGKKMDLLYEPESVYGTDALQFIRTKKVIDIHLDQKIILLNDGTLIEYEKCLIATGGEPRKLNFTSKDQEKITTYRTVDDFIKLHNFVQEGDKHITILGGGFLGSELTCGINQNFGKKKNIKVTQVFPENGVLPLVFPDYLSEYATEQIKKSGVEVLNKKLVKDVVESETNNGKLVVKLNDDSHFETDHVVVAVGIIPNSNVAKSTKLEIDPLNGGIMVNAELQARSDVYVAGDVASFYDHSIGQRRRMEHHDHAKVSGELAGINMSTDQKIPYTYQPFYWSDLTPNIGFEAVGNTDSKLKTFSVWEKSNDEKETSNQFTKGNIYYLNDKNVVVGVLCFGNYGKMETARNLIQKGKAVSDLNQLQHAISLEEEHH
ncbi:apoptosis inducing factor [Tieghemostelium lacteum]|uniref:Apoptosis inducing factor n=1 Tax=Tieghemostelium lacteum TaxID=361077 RepID=A0A151ZC97_TIELA|nr:apoptosis inducing factor [Tieghemostelium lacteum]|eukprot:KYQ91559.1 apoptosis inducing factor [Tieghemostelium lacteum]